MVKSLKANSISYYSFGTIKIRGNAFGQEFDSPCLHQVNMQCGEYC